MREYIVSIDIITALTASSYRISQLLGVSKSMLNYKIVNNEIIWKLPSELDNNTELIDHIEHILSFVYFDLNSKVDFRSIYLNIGVLYDTFTCTVELTSEYLSLIKSKIPEIGIEITCYPYIFE